jgi:hypothetical protein
MQATVLDLQLYYKKSPTPTCFKPYWSIIREYNKCKRKRQLIYVVVLQVEELLEIDRCRAERIVHWNLNINRRHETEHIYGNLLVKHGMEHVIHLYYYRRISITLCQLSC